MGVCFRTFRRTLYKRFVEKDETPFDEYKSIEPDDWADFVKYHKSEEFQVF